MSIHHYKVMLNYLHDKTQGYKRKYIVAILSKPRISTKHDFEGGRKNFPISFYFNVFFANNCILRWKTR